MLQNKSQKLKADLEIEIKKGVLIYQGDKLATPEDIAFVQWVNEDINYYPEFIVKDEFGEVKEIWYGETADFIMTD